MLQLDWWTLWSLYQPFTLSLYLHLCNLTCEVLQLDMVVGPSILATESCICRTKFGSAVYTHLDSEISKPTTTINIFYTDMAVKSFNVLYSLLRLYKSDIYAGYTVLTFHLPFTCHFWTFHSLNTSRPENLPPQVLLTLSHSQHFFHICSLVYVFVY